MNLTRINNKKYGITVIPDFPEFDLYDRVAQMVCNYYSELRTRIPTSIEDYSEERAVNVAHDMVGLLLHKGISIQRRVLTKDSFMRTLENNFNTSNKFRLVIEFNSSKKFREKSLTRPESYPDVAGRFDTAGYCRCEQETETKIYLVTKKVSKNLRAWIGVKTSNPFTDIPFNDGEQLDTMIHEFVHFMDRIEDYFSEEVEDIHFLVNLMFREWFKTLLRHYFELKEN